MREGETESRSWPMRGKPYYSKADVEFLLAHWRAQRAEAERMIAHWESELAWMEKEAASDGSVKVLTPDAA